MTAIGPSSARQALDDPLRGYAKGRAKRLEIIEHATALFGEVGYAAASLRAVAARSGLSHPGVLHHFPTKEALLVAVLQHRDEVDAQRVEVGRPGVSTFERLIGLIAVNATQREIVELFTTLSAEATSPQHPAHDYFVRRYGASVALFTRAYAQAARDGALCEAVAPNAAARQLVALMDGLQVQWLLDGGATDMPGLVRDHLQRQFTFPLGRGGL